MTSDTADTGSLGPAALRERLSSVRPPRVLDVRSPAEFHTAHIASSINIPVDVVSDRGGEVAERVGDDVVLVCQTGQRARRARERLRQYGVSATVLEGGIAGWQGDGLELTRGRQRWALERQVRLVAGSVVLSAVLGSIAVPRLKWAAGFIGAGLVFAAVSDTCAMGNGLSRLPYNRPGGYDADAAISSLPDPQPRVG